MTEKSDHETLLPLAKAAEMLCVAPTTLRQWARQGVIDYVRPGKKYLFRLSVLKCRLNSKSGFSKPANHKKRDRHHPKPAMPRKDGR